MTKKTPLAAIVLIAIAWSNASAKEAQRSISGPDYLVVQSVLAAVMKKEKKLDVSKFNVILTEGDEEFFVTLEPADPRARAYVGSSDVPSLEAVVAKKNLIVTQWYWSAGEGR
jgi:hypothetical protein